MPTTDSLSPPGPEHHSPANPLPDRQYEDHILLLLTLIIGALVGLVVVAFILLTEDLGARFFPNGGAPWLRLLLPLGGSLVAGFFLAKYFPNARGSGIPQAKTALFLRDGFISFRTVFGKFTMCAITLGSGVALGREGPAVQFSAGLASVLGRRLGLSPRSVRALVPIGSAAALAAAFNTPIAAVLFTLEEVMGDMHAPVLGSIVLSSATSWMVLHLLLGDEPLFHVPPYQLVSPVEFIFYAILGVAGGFVSVAFTKLLLWQRKYFLQLPQSTMPFQPAVGGLIVGLMGWFVPQALGVGYIFVGQALNGQMLLSTMALLIGLKLVGTATSYASGNAGGIFGPSLFIGAMLGGAVGGLAHMLQPDYTGSVGAYALVGMGTAFAGIIRVPLTSVIMVFEITRDYTIIVPLMIANLIAYFISAKFQEEPIYDALLHQDGIHLPSGTRAREELITVAHAFRPETPVLSASDRIGQIAATLEEGERRAWPVADRNGFRGMLTAEKLYAALAAHRDNEALGELVPEPLPADQLTAENFPHVHPDHPLDIALRRLAQSGLPVLPVVSRSNLRDLKGTISVEDILQSYALGRPAQTTAAAPQGSKPTRLMVGVGVALVGVVLVLGFVNYFERTARANRAVHDFAAGNRLMSEQRYEDAIAEYRAAVSAAHRVDYRLALALALVKAGHLEEARIYLREVLSEQRSSGPANLGMAEVDAQEGNIDEAVVFYNRAIDGTWPPSSAKASQFQARMELVNALAKAGRTPQAAAELLSIAAAGEYPDAEAEKQVGRMLIEFSLPKAAMAVYRDVVRQYPRDVEAWDGLGDAALAARDDSQARQAYRTSLQIDPADGHARAQLRTLR